MKKNLDGQRARGTDAKVPSTGKHPGNQSGPSARCKTCSGTGKEFNDVIGEFIEGSVCLDCNHL